MSENSQSNPSAGVIRRLAAMFYDGFLLFGVLFTAALPTLLFRGQPEVSNDEVIHELSPSAEGIFFQLYLLTVIILFFYLFWRKNGQTLGMQAWRLRIENSEGLPPTFRQSLLRLACASLSLACLGMGYWWIWLDSEGLAWHDRLSKTRVVVLPKSNK